MPTVSRAGPGSEQVWSDNVESKDWLTLAAAVIGSLVVIFTALWSTGGFAALQRRAIRQELEIADSLPDGLVKDAMRHRAELAASRYLYARLPTVWNRANILIFAVLVVLLVFPVMGLLGTASSEKREVLRIVDVAVAMLFALMVMGMVLWIGSSAFARDGLRRAEADREQLRLRDYLDATPTPGQRKLARSRVALSGRAERHGSPPDAQQ